MKKKELIEKIKKYLRKYYLDEDYDNWIDKLEIMTIADLNYLFDLLQEYIKNLHAFEDYLYELKDKFDEIQEEKREALYKIPDHISLLDLKIEKLAEIFNENLVSILVQERMNIFVELDEYFFLSRDLGEDIVEQFDILTEAIIRNQEVLFDDEKKTTIGEWLSLYDQFHDKNTRKSIDRVRFVNQDENAKILNQEARNILLRVLKIYDFLIDPNIVDLDQERERMGLGKAPKKIVNFDANLEKTLTRSIDSREKKVEKLESPKVTIKKEAKDVKKTIQNEKKAIGGLSKNKNIEKKQVEKKIENNKKEEVEFPKIKEKAKKIAELKKVIESYPKGSLERKAISSRLEKEQEIFTKLNELKKVYTNNPLAKRVLEEEREKLD